MTIRLLLFVTLTAPLWAQGGRGALPNREAPVTPVPFDRILRANQEPQKQRRSHDVRGRGQHEQDVRGQLVHVTARRR